MQWFNLLENILNIDTKTEHAYYLKKLFLLAYWLHWQKHLFIILQILLGRSEGTNYEPRISIEIVMHGGQSRIFQVVADTGGWPVNDGGHSCGIRMLPLVTWQIGHMLPNKSVQDTSVIQQLHWPHTVAILVIKLFFQ